ncbi:hypothetical protein C8R31_10663 [Nitrosospira sp. Nsp2]|nr:hypothetical protein C8R31_10663 [Nitrosospira sp. Nsp2]
MFRAALTILIDNISEIKHAAKGQYGSDRNGILYVKDVKIEILLLQIRRWGARVNESS